VAEGSRGAVATDHPLASAAGVRILREGGNAADAAAAAALVLGVVNPQASGIGGGSFAVVAEPGAQPHTYDFRETAPRATDVSLYAPPPGAAGSPVDAFGRPAIPATEKAQYGGLAPAIPGEVAGLHLLVTRHGKLPFTQVLAPAIEIAERGFAIGAHLAFSLDRVSGPMQKRPHLGCLPCGLFDMPAPPTQEGAFVRRPSLAATLRAIAERGPDGFYKGPVAQELVRAVRQGGGVWTLEDLAAYKVVERAPLIGTFRGYTLLGMAPPSSGGGSMIETLNILEKRGTTRRLSPKSPEFVHQVAEAMKHAFSDRARFYGDPAFVSVPIDKLTAKPYAAELAARIGKVPLRPEQYGMATALAQDIKGGGTSHISVMDKDGRAVALTTTVNTGFGSKLVAGTTGVVLNNEMDDFSYGTSRNAFGLVGSLSNRAQPGKRPTSSMTPTIVLDGPPGKGRPILVVGGSGGPRIISGTTLVTLLMLEHNYTVAAAVSAARIHHQWSPDKLMLEPGYAPAAVEELRKRGHTVEMAPFTFGAIQAVALDRRRKIKQPDGKAVSPRVAVSDPRKAGSPGAY
jgi:gamma-glutamyltranspeptidase/glutathione hydrolase